MRLWRRLHNTLAIVGAGGGGILLGCLWPAAIFLATVFAGSLIWDGLGWPWWLFATILMIGLLGAFEIFILATLVATVAGFFFGAWQYSLFFIGMLLAIMMIHLMGGLVFHAFTDNSHLDEWLEESINPILRWLLFIPLGYLAAAVLSLGLTFIMGFSLSEALWRLRIDEDGSLYFSLLLVVSTFSGGVLGAALVCIPALIAPLKRRVAAVWIAAAVPILLLVATIIVRVPTGQWLELIPTTVALISVVSVACSLGTGSANQMPAHAAEPASKVEPSSSAISETVDDEDGLWDDEDDEDWDWNEDEDEEDDLK